MSKERNEKNQVQDKKKTLLRLGKYLMQHKLMLLFAIILTVTSNVFSLIGPRLSGNAIDAIGLSKGEADFPRVFYYCTLMIIMYALSALLSYALSVLMVNLSQKIIYKMRKDLSDKLLSMPVSFFDRHQTGDIVSRMSYDIDTINSSLSHDFVQISTSAITILGSLFMMIKISPVLVLIFAVTIPISLLMTRYKAKKVRPLFKKRSAKLGELNGYAEEIITGQKSIKTYNSEDVYIDRFDGKNSDAVSAHYEAEYHGSTMGPSVNFVNNLSLALISMFGAILFLKGKLTPGNLSTFVLYSRKFSGPINEIANILSELQSSLAAAERVFRLIDEESEPADLPAAKAMENVRGNVELRNIDFSYDGIKTVLKNVNLKADKGSLIAIVGPTGAGKTTIINLLMRFYDPITGEITLDGTPYLDITRDSLRSSFAMVLQDTWLFGGTIYENIAYGNKNATREDVVRCAKAAKIHNYIMALPEGYDTYLSEDGINISQGQKQLLTIARAMLLDSKMLILDEATSNVDTRTEKEIQSAMTTLMKGKTCFVIAHRLSTVENADAILVINDGEIKEQGTHSELLEKGGIYASMYNSQYE